MLRPLFHQADPAFWNLLPLAGVSLDALPPDTDAVSLPGTSLRGVKRLAALRTLVLPSGALNKASLDALQGHPSIEQVSLPLKAAPGEALLAALGSLPRLRSVRVLTAKPDAARLAEIAKVPKLGSLEVDGQHKLAEDALASLGAASHLHTLRVGGLREHTPRLAEIARSLPSLAVLDIVHPRTVSAAAIAALPSLGALRGLGLVGGGLRSDEDYAPLAHMASLESLALGLCPASGKVATHIAALTGLRALDLGWSNVEGEHLAALSSLTRLEELNINNTKVPAPVLAELLRRLPLRVLHAGSQSVSSWLDALADHGAVEELSLANGSLPATAIATLARLPRLRDLDLSGLSGSTEPFAALDRLAPLERLSLSQLALSDAVVAAVGRLPRLRELNLGFVRGVTATGLRELAGATALRSLFLTRCEGVTAQVATALVSKLELQRLFLDGIAAIDDTTVGALRKIRPAMSLSAGA